MDYPLKRSFQHSNVTTFLHHFIYCKQWTSGKRRITYCCTQIFFRNWCEINDPIKYLQEPLSTSTNCMAPIYTVLQEHHRIINFEFLAILYLSGTAWTCYNILLTVNLVMIQNCMFMVLNPLCLMVFPQFAFSNKLCDFICTCIICFTNN